MSEARKWQRGGQMVAAAFILITGLVIPAGEAGALIRARRVLMHVLPAFEQCTAPNDTTESSGIMACVNPPAADLNCQFDTRGRGKVKMSARPDDVRILGALQGIDPACNGMTLELRITARVTTNDCSGGLQCTLEDLVDYPVGTCQVNAGRCQLDAMLNSVVPGGLFGENDDTHIEILGCGFTRIDGPNLPVRTFSCGLAMP